MLLASAMHAKVAAQPVLTLQGIVSRVTDPSTRAIFSSANAMRRALLEPLLMIRNSYVSHVELAVMFATVHNLKFA